MRNYFPKRTSGAPLHTLSKLYDVPVGFEPPHPLFWGSVFAVAEGWQLLDIGWFVVFLKIVNNFRAGGSGKLVGRYLSYEPLLHFVCTWHWYKI